LNNKQWGALRLSFTGTNRILVPNLLGYGKSGPWRSTEPFDLEQDVAVVSTMIEHAEEPVVLVGHSYGGYLAMKAALKTPERVRALLVHEPVIWGVLYDIGDPETIAEIERADADGLFLSEELGGKEEWWRRFVEIWGGEGAWDALPLERRRAFLGVGPKVFAEVRELYLDRTKIRTWAGLEMPVVITVGAGTQPLEAEACRVVAEALGDSRLVDIVGGHMAPLTATGAFVRELVDLLERLESA
jgi:pimeloyl-ACP methyl ester carboxylesterase